MSWAIWITGLPGSGKSTIARGVVAALEAEGRPVHHLELDALRKVLTPAPTYASEEREIVYRALVYLARTLTDSGVGVVIDATAHRREWRDLARAVIPRFAEVQVSCPLELCMERERTRKPGHAPRDIYARAGRRSSSVPGVDVAYEPALAPDITVDTATEDLNTAVARVARVARSLSTDVWPRTTEPERAWAIWITGLPGSGKTTLAFAVAEALLRDNVAVKVLDLASLQTIAPTAARGIAWQELACRTLAYAAHLLTTHGIPVIVDATAPQRAARELARELVNRFGEVQLVCPLALCGERERAARWHLGLSEPRSREVPAETWPDVVLQYEHAVNPDLVIRTDVQHMGSAIRDVLRLCARLTYDQDALSHRRIS